MLSASWLLFTDQTLKNGAVNDRNTFPKLSILNVSSVLHRKPSTGNITTGNRQSASTLARERDATRKNFHVSIYN